MVLDFLKKLFKGKNTNESSSDASPAQVENAFSTAHETNEEMELETPSAKEEREIEEAAEHTREEEERPGGTREEAFRIMEAALFMTPKGLGIEDLGRMANIPLLHAREYIPSMMDAFNAQHNAMEIVEDTGGYRMRVRAPYDEKVSHLAGGGDLTPAEMKTLAFIAYKQPLLQAQLVQVRSNTAYEHLQLLVEKGFVSREPKGRSFLLRTTKKFAEYFGTNALKLRPMKEMQEDHSQSKEYL